MNAQSMSPSTVLGVSLRLLAILTSADPDRIVSVPSAPLLFQAEDLTFHGARNTKQESALAEFSELMNRIPTSPVWEPAAEVHLWDVYAEVLGADLARDTLSPQERERYQAAEQYLYEAGADGVRRPTAALQSYQTAEQLWLEAALAYNNAETAAILADDEGSRQRWTDTEKPNLQRARDEALASWTVNYHKNEVDDAYRTIGDLGAKMPVAVWNRYRTAFDPNDVARFNTGANQMKFAPTFFTPGNVVDSPWVRVELSRHEVSAMIALAPAEVLDALGNSVEEGLETIAFDYCVVTISRPWLDPILPLFSSRAWKFSGDTGPLSDGGSPARGRCPGYVDSAVFVRNIETQLVADRRETVSAGEVWLSAGEEFDFDKGWKIGGSPDVGFGVLEPLFEGGVCRWVPRDGAKVAYFIKTNPERIMGDPVDIPFEDVTLSELSQLTYESDPETGYVDMLATTESTPHMFGVLTTAGNIAKVEVTQYGSPVRIRWVTYVGGDMPDVTAATAPGEIRIGAIMSRRLPKSPDPDPALLW